MHTRNLRYPPRAARERVAVLSSESFRNPAQPGLTEFPASTACSERLTLRAGDRSAGAKCSPHGTAQKGDAVREAPQDHGISHVRTSHKRRLPTHPLFPDSNERALRRPDCGLEKR